MGRHRPTVEGVLRVLDANRGTERSATEQGRDGRWEKIEPDYALFPAQEDRLRIGKLYLGGRFRVEIDISPKATGQLLLPQL